MNTTGQGKKKGRQQNQNTNILTGLYRVYFRMNESSSSGSSQQVSKKQLKQMKAVAAAAQELQNMNKQ